MATQKLPTILKTVDDKGKLTFYSLYKQINECDADEVPGNQEATQPTKQYIFLGKITFFNQQSLALAEGQIYRTMLNGVYISVIPLRSLNERNHRLNFDKED